MTKDEFEKMPRGEEISSEDYICTNINPYEMKYVIRIKPDETEYVVMYAMTKPKMYFIVVNNEIRPLSKDVLKMYKQTVREYEKYGI